MKDLFPAFLDLTSQKCLVIGGGAVAERKIKVLLQCRAEVFVVSPDLTSTLMDLVAQDRIIYFPRTFLPQDTEGKFLIIAAAADKAVNSYLNEEYIKQGFLLNIADEPTKGNFLIPSSFQRGKLKIAVSTAGASPLLAVKIRKKLEKDFGNEYERYLDILSEIRKEVLDTIPQPEKREKIFQALINSDILELLKEGDEEKVKERINQCLS